ncbi:MAG: hypothetical protein WBB73_02205 [Candidatus Aminicenantaceae bacterium]
MNSILDFLLRHKWFTWVFGSLYFISTVIFHKPVARLSLKIEQQTTYAAYNRGWGVFALAALTLVLAAVVIKIMKGEDRIFKLFFLALTFGLIGITHWAVLAVNLEYIHVMQFSLLVFPLLALIRRFGETVFWIGLLGALDELYQYYVVWWPHQSYYDFNDVILDIAGGAFMVFLIYLWLKQAALFPQGHLPKIRWLRSPSAITAAGILVFALLAPAAGLLSYYPEAERSPDSQAAILLSRDPPAPQFWSVFEKGKTYHIVGAGEWMALLLLCTGLYSFLDWRLRKTPQAPSGREGA